MSEKKELKVDETRVSFSDANKTSTMTFDQFREEQQKLREQFRAITPYVKAEGYREAMKTVKKLAGYQLEGTPNVASGGVSIFIDSESDFQNLGKFSTETASTIFLTERK